MRQLLEECYTPMLPAHGSYEKAQTVFEVQADEVAASLGPTRERLRRPAVGGLVTAPWLPPPVLPM
jgi:hypothetical protein